MSKKQMLFDANSRSHLGRGVEKLANAVGVTLGPRGRNVMLEKAFGKSVITKDGVSVSKEVELPEPFENMGAKLLNEVATRTNKEAGDGTTTSIVLAEAMIREGSKYVLAGVSPIALRAGMEKAVDKAVEELAAISQPVSGKRSIEDVGRMSSNGDEELAGMFAEAITKAGTRGVVKVEENEGVDTILEFVDGMEFDKGFTSPYFITNPGEQKAVLQNPYLLVTDRKISSVQDLVPVLEKIAATQRPLFIVAEEIEGEALAALIINKLRGVLNVAASKAPGFGDRRKAMLEDLSVITGATFFSKDIGADLNDIELSQLGQCEKIEIDKDTTQFFKGKGKKANLEARVRQIESQIEQTKSNYDREKLEERRAKLEGKIAIIRVGGATEPEMKERKDRAEDALNATRAAAEEGIVLGSGVAYLRVADAVSKVSAPGDEKFGVDVVLRSLSAPLSQLGENAGLDGPALVAEVEDMDGNRGYDVLNEKEVDLFRAGIVDPLKVVRSALQNAASVAKLHLISDTVVTDLGDDDRIEGAVR